MDSKKRVDGLQQEAAAQSPPPKNPPIKKENAPISTYKIPKITKRDCSKMYSPLISPNKRTKHSLSLYSPNHTPEQKKTLNEIKTFFKRENHTLHLNYGKNTFSRCQCMSHSVGNLLTASSFKLFDSESGWNFLIDTGACKSFVPKPKKTLVNLSPYEGPKIVTANGQPLKIYGSIRLHIKIANRKYTWSFIVADIALPILGADFLAAHKLAVDIAGQRLITREEIKPRILASTTERPSIPPSIQNVLDEFKEVFSTDLTKRKNLYRTHSATHRINTCSPPIRSKFRRLNPEKLQIAKEVFQDLEKAGICQKAASPWASPLHMVKKADGSYRPCRDYRRLNTVTEPDHYPLPNISDITNVLGGC